MIYLIVISLMLGAIWLLVHLHNKKKTEIQNMSDEELFEPIRSIVSPRNDTENFVQSFQPNIPQRFPSNPPPARPPQRIQNFRSWPTQQVSNHSSYNDSNIFPDPVESLIIGSVLSNSFESESRICCDNFSSSSSDYSSNDSGNSCSDYSSSSSYDSGSCDSSSSDSGSCSCSD